MNKKISIHTLFIAALALFGVGCAGLLPSDSTVTISKWNSYDEATKAFDKVIVEETTEEQLKILGFDPTKTPNIKILTFLDVKKHFIASPLDKEEYIPKGVRMCIENTDACHGLGVNISRSDNKRYGNAFLDVFNFRRQTELKGWEFDGLIILKHNIVVYKLVGGKPITEANKDETNPLGPLQSSSSIFLLNNNR